MEVALPLRLSIAMVVPEVALPLKVAGKVDVSHLVKLLFRQKIMQPSLGVLTSLVSLIRLHNKVVNLLDKMLVMVDVLMMVVTMLPVVVVTAGGEVNCIFTCIYI